MVLHSIQIGTRNVHVRTDDCDAQELERVHETVRLVGRIHDRYGSQVCGLFAGVVVCLVSVGITLSTMSPGPARAVIPLVTLVFTSMLGWCLIGDAVQQRQFADAARLQALTKESARCRDFVIECIEASLTLRRGLGDLVPRPKTA